VRRKLRPAGRLATNKIRYYRQAKKEVLRLLGKFRMLRFFPLPPAFVTNLQIKEGMWTQFNGR
jgi:hypothetical protein